MTKTHTDLSPSNANRWMNCPGSVALCRTVPKLEQSDAAFEGEAAHWLLEKCLKNPKNNPFDWVGEKYEGQEEITEEMAEAVSFALEEIRKELQKGDTILVEHKVIIVPDLIEGTLDVAICRDFDRIIVFDFKYGKGTIVEAMDNPQLLLYLIPLAKMFDVATMKLVILQPRTSDQIRVWECNAEYLETFTAELERKIALTQEKDALVCPGKWCRWCAAKIVCPGLKKDLSDNLPAVSGKELIFPDVKGLSIEVVKNVLDYTDRIEAWLKAVWQYAFDVLDTGGSIPGYVLGKKRANRKWINEEDALLEFQDLGEKAYSIKILTPAQMEKIAGKDRVAKLTEVPDNGMTIKKEEKKNEPKK